MTVLSLLTLALFACSGEEPNVDDTDVTDTDVTDTGDTDPTGDTDTDTGADTDSGGDTDTDTSEDTDTVPADNIATQLGTCLDYFREPDAYPNQLIAGDELQRYTLADPEARCNDGTRAVIYVRPATDDALADVWELHLQGGSSCTSWASCAARWCGLAYYDASKMSSAWAPDEIGAVGILDEDPANRLAGANHVFFYYCSSDNWSGQGSMHLEVPDTIDVGADTGAPVELPDLPAFSMFRRGHQILAAGLDELEAGVVSDLGEAMPSLTNASVVLLNGTSAGSSGAKINADYVSDRLTANGSRVVAVFDASNTPPTEFWPEAYRADVDAASVDAWTSAVADNDVLPFLDASCEAIYGGTDELWRCYSPTWIMMNHITTPFFVRQDLRDTGTLAVVLEIAEDEHEQAVLDSLVALADIQATAVEGDSIRVVPGAYGPNCAQQVALESSDWWRVATVTGPSDEQVTFQDAVGAWFAGDSVAVLDSPTIGEGPGPDSVCSGVDDER